MAKKKLTRAERQEWAEARRRMVENAERTRQLAEAGQAKLDAQAQSARKAS